MSWWDTGNSDDVIGDRPADLVRHTLKQISEATPLRSAKPVLADLLRAIGVVATGSDAVMLEERPTNLRAIVADLKSGGAVTSGPLREDPRSAELRAPLVENLRAAAAVYQERFGRNPRFSEWLATFEFVLRYKPEDFLGDGVEHPPATLKAETGEAT